jgi:hypothetical protein
VYIDVAWECYSLAEVYDDGWQVYVVFSKCMMMLAGVYEVMLAGV